MQSWLNAAQTKPKLLLVDDQRINILALHEVFRASCEVFIAIVITVIFFFFHFFLFIRTDTIFFCFFTLRASFFFFLKLSF